MRYVIRAFLNETRGSRFEEWSPDATYSYAGEYTVSVGSLPAEPRLVAANYMWPIGNKMERDNDGRAWPLFLRSLSVGDILVVRNEEGGDFDPGVPFAVTGDGFERIERDFHMSLSTGGKVWLSATFASVGA